MTELPHPHPPAPHAELKDAEHPPSMMELLGGPLGIAEASLPTVVFVIGTTAGLEIREAGIAAVALAVLFALARIPKRETKQFALFGVIGVAFSAWVASRTGQAKDFFLPGFLANVGYAALAFVSVAARRPFIGYVVDGFAEGTPWRRDPVKMRKFRLASLMWGGLFLLRLAVQLPLYFADQDVALGTAKVAMGLPLFALGIWLTWLIVREPAIEQPAEGAADGLAADPGGAPAGDAGKPAS